MLATGALQSLSPFEFLEKNIFPKTTPNLDRIVYRPGLEASNPRNKPAWNCIGRTRKTSGIVTGYACYSENVNEVWTTDLYVPTRAAFFLSF
jgi:hypothetical protein